MNAIARPILNLAFPVVVLAVAFLGANPTAAAQPPRAASVRANAVTGGPGSHARIDRATWRAVKRELRRLVRNPALRATLRGRGIAVEIATLRDEDTVLLTHRGLVVESFGDRRPAVFTRTGQLLRMVDDFLDLSSQPFRVAQRIDHRDLATPVTPERIRATVRVALDATQ